MYRLSKLIATITLICTFVFSSFSQSFYGSKASAYVKGSEEVLFKKGIKNPQYIKFNEGNEIGVDDFLPWLSKNFKISDRISYKLLRSAKDDIGFVNYKYQQLFDNIPVYGAVFFTHAKNGKVLSFNGEFYSDIIFENSITLGEEDALQFALNSVKSENYIWQFPEEEQWLKSYKNDPNATYYPKGSLAIVKKNNEFYYTYKFDIYSKKPLTRPDVFVDAQSGNVLMKNEKITSANATGTAATKYSGTKTITTDSYNGSYRLRETARGGTTAIQTWDMNQGTNYGSAVDFTDTDNNWNTTTNLDNAAYDAHWGSETTFDYFYTKFARNSLDNAGYTILSYVHYDNAYLNAFSDGQRFSYGDGSSQNGNNPLTCLEVVAHEMVHGLSGFEAGFGSSGEAPSLNEGFSDIFGTTIEFWAKPTTADWQMGEEINFVMRNIQDPSLTDNPDTYLGTNWDPGLESHQNSTVLSHWYYLLCLGGAGANDNGNPYSVAGITMAKAEKIAYRTLTEYLTSNSDYYDARFYSIKATADLYGGCSAEVEAATDAWYAVGVGDPYVAGVVVNFTGDNVSNCSSPLTVNFANGTMNANTFLWKFGDGATSTVSDPSHTYTAAGTYNVKLIADGGVCGKDSILKNSYIVISPSATASLSMSLAGTGQAQTCCLGTLKDPGGADDYPDNITSTITISPSGAAFIVLNFTSFNLENNYDYLKIYNGPSTASPLIGNYTGANLPNGGQIISTASSITLQFTSDQGVTSTGFELEWECAGAVVLPAADFQANETTTCSGLIQFTDLSANYPTSWIWKFGDGDSSLVKNPVHKYLANGDYTVTLKAKNSAGANSAVKANYIHVGTPAPPILTGDTVCNSGNASLYVSSPGYDIYSWYDAATNGNFITYGTSYTTPVLSSNTTYYVEGMTYTPSLYGAKTDSSGGGGGYYGNTSNIHYLIFNALKPFELISVKVYASGAGNRNIILRDSAQNVIKDTTVSVPAGQSRVTLNFKVPVGNKMQLVGGGAPNLYRNRLTATYPYTMAGVFSVTESSASLAPYNAANNYYYFYDWEVKATDCITARTPVTALVTSCSGIKEGLTENSFNVYPVPASNYVNVEFKSNLYEKFNFELTDITGRTVKYFAKEVNAGNSVLTFDISDLSKGIYLLEISNDSFKVTKKIIAE
jgi:Zn-dependent metalloprotease